MPETGRNTLIICGSPRIGNTQYLCEQIQEGLDHPSEILEIRRQSILACTGCLICNRGEPCNLDRKDRMDELRAKIKAASCLVVGAPNYWDGVPGPLRTFIDRLNPLYAQVHSEGDANTDLVGKPFLRFMVGGRANEEFCLRNGLDGLSRHLRLKLIGSHYIQALNHRDLKDNPDRASAIIATMVSEINTAVAESK